MLTLEEVHKAEEQILTLGLDEKTTEKLLEAVKKYKMDIFKRQKRGLTSGLNVPPSTNPSKTS